MEKEKKRETGMGEREKDMSVRRRERETGMGERTREKIERETGYERER